MHRIIDQEKDRVGPWVMQRAGGFFHTDSMSAIGLEKDEILIAGVVYDSYRVRSICMHVACDQSFTREFIWFAFYYPFEQLGVQKVIGLVESSNDEALDINRRLGFKREHTIENATPDGDLIILSMTKDQCKWLNAVKRQGAQNGWRKGR